MKMNYSLNNSNLKCLYVFDIYVNKKNNVFFMIRMIADKNNQIRLNLEGIKGVRKI